MHRISPLPPFFLAAGPKETSSGESSERRILSRPLPRLNARGQLQRGVRVDPPCHMRYASLQGALHLGARAHDAVASDAIDLPYTGLCTPPLPAGCGCAWCAEPQTLERPKAFRGSDRGPERRSIMG